MKTNIIVKPADLWRVFQLSDPDEFPMLIAENEEFGVEVYLDGNPEGNFGMIDVIADGIDCVESLGFADASEAAEVADVVYESYLTTSIFSLLEGDDIADICADDEEDEAGFYERIIERREEELIEAFEGFIDTVLEGDTVSAAKAQVLLDRVLRLIADNGVDVYRPMAFTGEDGEVFYEDYPYESVDFED